MRIRAALSIIVMLAVVGSAQAAGGGPLYLTVGGTGVAVPDAPMRYVTTAVGHDTLLQRVRRRGGQVTGSRLIRGRMGIPAVAMDETAGGLSADGRRLVLIKPVRRFPVRWSQFAVVDTAGLHVRRFTLRGEWSFDAISPDGSSLYLTEYPFISDPGRYAVRRYDVTHHRLAPGVIVDKREPDEAMAGSPITRVMSPHGRWAYTLYDGSEGSGEPFIHALDTVRRRAFCVDLDDLSDLYTSDLFALRLVWTRRGIGVRDHSETIATVNPRTLAVTRGSGRSPGVWF